MGGSALLPLPILVVIFSRYVKRAFYLPTEVLPLGIASDIDNGRDAVSESTSISSPTMAPPARTTRTPWLLPPTRPLLSRAGPPGLPDPTPSASTRLSATPAVPENPERGGRASVFLPPSLRIPNLIPGPPLPPLPRKP